MPQISCPIFSVAPSGWDGECADQWMEVTDGIVGFQKFCGRKGPMNVVVAEYNGLRDLYIAFRNKYRMFQARFECNVSCGSKSKILFLPKIFANHIHKNCKISYYNLDTANFLPDVLTPKVNEDCRKLFIILFFGIIDA